MLPCAVCSYIRAAAETTTGGAQARPPQQPGGGDLAALCLSRQRVRQVNIADRSYLLRIYPECFVASEASSGSNAPGSVATGR